MESPKGLKEFIRNPLGIIALFITMIYGVANLLLGKSVESLSSAERWPLILFVVFFPLVVLVAFYWLVKNHHKKLYAPQDYRSDESFLQALNTVEVIERLQEEVKESSVLSEPSVSESDPELSDHGGNLGNSGSSTVAEQMETVSAPAPQVISPVGIAPPEVSAVKVGERIGSKMFELAKLTEYLKVHRYPRFSSSDSVSNVRIGRTDVEYDAAYLEGGVLNAFEVKYVRAGEAANRIIRQALLKAADTARSVGFDSFKLLLVVVHRWNDDDLHEISTSWQDLVKKDFPYVSIEFVRRGSIPV